MCLRSKVDFFPSPSSPGPLRRMFWTSAVCPPRVNSRSPLISALQEHQAVRKQKGDRRKVTQSLKNEREDKSRLRGRIVKLLRLCTTFARLRSPPLIMNFSPRLRSCFLTFYQQQVFAIVMRITRGFRRLVLTVLAAPEPRRE